MTCYSVKLNILHYVALTGKRVIRAGEGIIRGGENSERRPILLLILKYKNIMKINLNLMVFIQEIIYLK